MTIADQINRLNNAKANIKQAIENKGVEVSDSALLDEYPALISSIPMEGGDPYYEDLYNMRTSNGTNMASMFARTSGELDLRRLDVSNVTSMEYMFDYSSASVNIDGWDTSKVTDMSYMFYYFTSSIDASKLDTSNVTNADYMFAYTNPDNIILTGLSFPKATSLANMFNGAKGTTLDLSSWDINNITNMSSMFAGYFTKIDLTGWDTSHVTNMSSMFYQYSSPLVELIIPDWDMTNCSHNIFYNSSYVPNLKLIDLSRSNDATIIKIASFLPTRTATTFGTVLVPENTSQEAYDALVAKYWKPEGTALSLIPTSCEIVADLDEIMPGKSTKVYLGACEPWYADPSKAELVLVSDSSIATMTDNNEVISTGVVGNIEVAARLIETQEVIGTKIIVVSETDSYPNLVKFRLASTPSTYDTMITVNNSSKYIGALTYDSITDIYSYDAGVPITSIKFPSNKHINELIKLNISNITSMKEMFYNCSKLTTLDVSNWDTSKVTNMDSMFYGCALTELDLSSFNTSNVTTMMGMFRSCNSLTKLDLSNFDTSNVIDMEYMFYGCQSLTELNLSNWDASKVTDVYQMFTNCTSLHTLRLDNCSNDTINKIITSSRLSTIAISGVIKTIYCKEENAAGLTPPKNWVFSYVTEEEPEVPVEPSIPLYEPGEFAYNTDITEVETMVNESHTDLSSMFAECTNLISVNTEDWDTSNVENMSYMFDQCTDLTSLDLNKFNTSSVTDMQGMFYYCSNLTTLDLSNWNTSNVTDMNSMFYYCSSLEELDIRNFDLIYGESGISSGTRIEISGMFNGCSKLKVLHLENCSTATVVHLLESSGLPARGNNDGIMYMSADAYQGAKHIVPDGWTIFTE